MPEIGIFLLEIYDGSSLFLNNIFANIWLLFLQSSITIFSLLIVDAIPETLPSPLIFPVLVDNLIVTFLFLFIDFANIPDASSFASISPLLLHSLIITSFSAFAIIPADVPFSPASALIFPLLFEFIIYK